MNKDVLEINEYQELSYLFFIFIVIFSIHLFISFLHIEHQNGQKCPHLVWVRNKKIKAQLKKKAEKKVKKMRSNRKGGSISFGGIDRPVS